MGHLMKGKMLIPVVKVNRTFTGDWEADKHILKELAESPMTAKTAYQHAHVVMTLFNQLTYNTPFAPDYPMRSGLVRKVYDELFPIAHFAKLYFSESSEVVICWRDGNQQFDAVVEDERLNSGEPRINYLEVTTLQDGKDAKFLSRMARETTICIEGSQDESNHLRKVELLKVALKKKAAIKYPPQTALLVYTDEDRFQWFSFGQNVLEIDRRSSFKAALEEMQDILTGFSKVFIYSEHEIYCSLVNR
jgi:hypothetical protein